MKGEARICFKLHGSSITHGLNKEQARDNLMQGLT
jgi:hypothetical protein